MYIDHSIPRAGQRPPKSEEKEEEDQQFSSGNESLSGA